MVTEHPRASSFGFELRVTPRGLVCLGRPHTSGKPIFAFFLTQRRTTFLLYLNQTRYEFRARSISDNGIDSVASRFLSADENKMPVSFLVVVGGGEKMLNFSHSGYGTFTARGLLRVSLNRNVPVIPGRFLDALAAGKDDTEYYSTKKRRGTDRVRANTNKPKTHKDAIDREKSNIDAMNAMACNFRFETLDGRRVDLNLSTMADTRRRQLTVQSVKPLLELQFEIPAAEQEFVYCDSTSQLLLHDEAILYPQYDQKIIVRPKNREITLMIKSMDVPAATVGFRVNLQDTIVSVKQRVQHVLDFPVEDQMLYYQDQELCDDQSMRFYQVTENAALLLWNRRKIQHYCIFVKKLDGKTLSVFGVNQMHTVRMIKAKICHSELGAPDELRLVFNGKQLQDDMFLSEYGITIHSTLHAVLRLRGMISSFTYTDQSDPLVRYLMLPDDAREKTPFPLEALLARFGSDSGALGSDSGTPGFEYEPDCGIIEEAHRSVICRFLDFMWNRHMENTDGVDMKIVLPGSTLVALLGPFTARCNDLIKPKNPEKVFDELRGKFSGPGYPKIALRMTKGPTNGCIGFHRDGIVHRAVSGYTHQLALNNPADFQGGKLCYFTENRLQVLTRPAGSLVGHGPFTLHAVTALTGGIRKSLFLVDLQNGLGERDIIDATPRDVEAFWSSDFSTLCSYCFVHHTDKVCPGNCSQKNLCPNCCEIFGECFQCRIVTMTKCRAETRGNKRRWSST